MDHLYLPASLLCNLAAKFVGPYSIVAASNHVAFCLELPSKWKIHGLFHKMYLKPSIGFTGGPLSDSVFRP